MAQHSAATVNRYRWMSHGILRSPDNENVHGEIDHGLATKLITAEPNRTSPVISTRTVQNFVHLL